ncbi:MAG: ABC transporter ATP-binding protein [Bacteroidales bacterium]|jgi:subfamily B ATP-binding cassette protein MsbA|nr:ABC transporter ATP-binding protein [Bacteroidales bacterium]
MIKQFFSVMGRYIKPYKKYMIWSVVLNFVSQWLSVFSFMALVPILNILFQVEEKHYEYKEIGSIFDEDAIATLKDNGYWYIQQLIAEHGQMYILLLMGTVLIVMTGLRCGSYFVSSAIMIPFRTGVVKDIRIAVYDKVLRLPLSFFSEERKGDIVARMSSDAQVVESSLTSSVDMLIKNPIAILVIFTTLFAISWQLTLCVLLVAPLMIWGIGSITRNLKRRSKYTQQQWGEIMTELDETLGGLRIIKAFLAEQKMLRRFTVTNENYRKGTSGVAIRQSSAHPVSEFLGTAVIVIVLWIGGYFILTQEVMNAGEFIYYLVMLYMVINPLKEFSKAFYQVPQGLASMERIDMILKAENPITDPAEPKPLANFEQGIELRDVSFHYANSEVDVLKHVNLTVEKGKTIALVGQSGSGKSTLVDLIPRYHDVTGGEIFIDGKNVKDVRISDLRALIGNVNQEAILFNDTIFNNITFGVENATMDEVIAAAKIANAHDFIMEMPDGYQTCIGDRGGRLSGGQRQRISIARAILKNPPILILDEATSALDTESERLVQDALERLMKSRTTIAIAHRLSTIKNADEICVLYEGEIVERGTHEELIAKGGYYKKLNDMQSL